MQKICEALKADTVTAKTLSIKKAGIFQGEANLIWQDYEKIRECTRETQTLLTYCRTFLQTVYLVPQNRDV